MKLFKKKKALDENSICYRIEGMSCNHCKMSVEKAINALPNVENCTVDLRKKCAIVIGTPDNEAVKKAVEDIGFKFVGKLNE